MAYRNRTNMQCALGLGVAGTAWAAVPVSVAWLGIALWLGRKQRAMSTGAA